jgi:hypothetical protein
MALTVQPAGQSDLTTIVDLLIEDAMQRQAAGQVLWKLAANARDKVTSTLKAAMENENPALREQWFVASADEKIVGISHTILLPVPPIYAGEFGPPGLIMEDSFVSKNAPEDTYSALLQAAETDLREAGAKLLLASAAKDSPWEPEFTAHGYQPLTHYLAKTGLIKNGQVDDVRTATAEDIPEIVRTSAINRNILFDLDAFWKPHPDADARFGDWMTFSLGLTDRDMFVAKAEGDLEGYLVSQPATPLHCPVSHDISATGMIDDYFHTGFENQHELKDATHGAVNLLRSAEVALQSRECDAVLVVCPAAWKSKIQLLETAGYETAISWLIKR